VVTSACFAGMPKVARTSAMPMATQRDFTSRQYVSVRPTTRLFHLTIPLRNPGANPVCCSVSAKICSVPGVLSSVRAHTSSMKSMNPASE